MLLTLQNSRKFYNSESTEPGDWTWFKSNPDSPYKVRSTCQPPQACMQTLLCCSLAQQSMRPSSDKRPHANLFSAVASKEGCTGSCIAKYVTQACKACISQTLISACTALTVLWLQLLAMASLAAVSHGHLLGCNCKCPTGTQNASFGASSVHASFIVRAHTQTCFDK